MPRTASTSPDTHGTADARLGFLTTGLADARALRPLILASWQRSRELDVAADNIALPYREAPESDTLLARSATPVLRRLHDQLGSQPVSIVLTDAAGVVVDRLTGDGQLERYLDGVLLAPGFSYAEQFVGTNGIGTALEAGRPAEVFGHEHYAENLETLACAGAPIHDPISGRLVGVVDLTCWRKDAESLLLTLAKATAEQVEHAMRTRSSLREFEVMQAYRQTCRRSRGIVLAVTDDAVVLNDVARAELDPADQAALLASAAEAAGSLRRPGRGPLRIMLPSGARARLHCQRVGPAAEAAGVVVSVKIDAAESVDAVATRESADVSGGAAAGSTGGGAQARMQLPGLVGNAPLWRRACREVEAAAAANEWVLLEGEAGTGKMSLLRAVHRRCHPAGHATVLDARDAGSTPGWCAQLRGALVADDTVVIGHVDELTGADGRAVRAALDAVTRDPAAHRPWVAATRRPATGPDGGSDGGLESCFSRTCEVPPLRLRVDDLVLLIPFFLAKFARVGHLTFSSAAQHKLMCAHWPGNVQQVHDLLRDVVSRRRSGTITVDDLPPELHTVSRRVLSTLESMERDAIVRSLVDAAGNKARAAEALGMSRATIYRKIHEFGIVPPA